MPFLLSTADSKLSLSKTVQKIRAPVDGRVGNGVETRRTKASFARGPGGLEDGWSYCTSTVMLWVAMTGSWSLVAPVTVTLCVPLLRPLSIPAKPF
jgi:hypothetical protein